MTFEELNDAVNRLEDKAGDFISLRTDFKSGRPEIVIDSLVTMDNVDCFIAVLQAMKLLGNQEKK